MLFRDMKLFLSSLKAVLIAAVLLMAALFGAVAAMIGTETKSTQIWTVAAYNEDTENDLGTMVIDFIETSSMISSYLKVAFYDTEEAAIQAVEDGAVAAVLVPKNFFSNVAYGEPIRVRLILNDRAESGKNSIITFSNYGSDLLTDGQVSVYAGDQILKEMGADEPTRDDFNLFLNLAMMDEANSALTKYFEPIEIPYTAHGLGMTEHYIALYMCLFLVMLTLCFYGLYQTDTTRAKLLRLRSAGITEGRYQFWKILLPTLLFFLLMILVLIAAGRFAVVTIRIESILGVLLTAGFCAAFCSLLAMGIGGASGACSFLLFVAGLFFCGGIIPYSRLAPITLYIGRFTPTGVMYHLLNPVFGGKILWESLPIGAVYLVIAGWLAHKRYRRILLGRDEA